MSSESFIVKSSADGDCDGGANWASSIGRPEKEREREREREREERRGRKVKPGNMVQLNTNALSVKIQ